MSLDGALEPRGPQRRLKVIPRQVPRAMTEIGHRGRGVRIHGDYRTKIEALCDRSQTNGGLSFEAANFEDDTLRGGARRHKRQESGFALREKPRSGPYSCPGLLNGRSKIRGRSQQYCSKAAVRSAAMSRALRPSILRRSSMNTSRPSLNSAICGEDGA